MPRIEIKLYAMLREHLPPGSRGVTAELTIDETATVQGVLDALAVPVALRQLVVLNDEEIDAAGGVSTRLRDGDRLSVFPPVAGG